MDPHHQRSVSDLRQEPLRSLHIWLAAGGLQSCCHTDPAGSLLTTQNSGCAGATLCSFVFAFLHFTTELVVFGTLSWKKALAPLIVAGGACWQNLNMYPLSSAH